MADAGDPKSDVLWILGTFVLIGILWWASGAPERTGLTAYPLIASPLDTDRRQSATELRQRDHWVSPDGSQGAGDLSGGLRSPYAGMVRLGRGNARGENQPRYEYLTIQVLRSSPAPVVATGWTLANQRQSVQRQPNSLQPDFGTSQRVVIPAGSLQYPVRGSFALAPIIMNPGDYAVVTTGRPPDSGPYPARASFKTNKCTGYLSRLPRKADLFDPPLPTDQCPDPEAAPGVADLPEACYEFVQSLPRCHTPVFDTQRRGEPDLVDGQIGIDRSCQNYLREHYSYEACVARHQNDADFLGSEWRIYLGQSRDLWSDRTDTITLYDQSGLIIDQISY